MAIEFMKIKYLQNQYNKKAWYSSFKTKPLLLALIAKKVKYKALDFENCMLSSSTDKEKRASISSPSNGKLVITTTSKCIGLMEAKGKMKPLMKVAQNPKKQKMWVVLKRISCRESMMVS